MDVIGRSVPKELAATAQTIYATIAMGATSALVTLASGPLYQQYGAHAFWAMAAMCALALPLTMGIWRLTVPRNQRLSEMFGE